MALIYAQPTQTDLLDPRQLAARLMEVVATAEDRLLSLEEQAASHAPAVGKWTPKEVIGHLIDSAANNWQRFVRLQLQPSIDLPGYQQEGWVRVQHYNERPWLEVIALWVALNHHLAHTITHTDRAALTNIWHFRAVPGMVWCGPFPLSF